MDGAENIPYDKGVKEQPSLFDAALDKRQPFSMYNRNKMKRSSSENLSVLTMLSTVTTSSSVTSSSLEDVVKNVNDEQVSSSGIEGTKTYKTLPKIQTIHNDIDEEDGKSNESGYDTNSSSSSQDGSGSLLHYQLTPRQAAITARANAIPR